MAPTMRSFAMCLAAVLELTHAGADVRHGSHGNGGCTPDDKSYDYLMLVQTWPNSGCLYESCTDSYAALSVWTLHGLWPSRTGSQARSYPCQCDDRQFDPSQLSSIKDTLLKVWPSQFSDQDSFWSHEWEKHGTCASDVPSLKTELGFFNGTVQQRATHDIGAALQAASIVPSNSKTYGLDAIVAALLKVTGHEPTIGCLKHDGKQYLHQIAWCVGKDLKDENCDAAARTESDNCESSEPITLVEPASTRITVSV